MPILPVRTSYLNRFPRLFLNSDTGSSGVRLEHFLLKAAVAHEIEIKGPWATEVEYDEWGGWTCWIVGWPDGRAVVYEIEGDCTPERRRAKAEQYMGPLVWDVLVVPMERAPASVSAVQQWVASRIVA